MTTATFRTRVAAAVADAVEAACKAGDLPDHTGPAAFDVVHSDRADHGDYASNVALKLAGPLKRPPREIAEALAARLTAGSTDGLISRAEAAGPGFLNLWLGE